MLDILTPDALDPTPRTATALAKLADESVRGEAYGQVLRELGYVLGLRLLARKGAPDRALALGMLAEDADTLGQGFLDAMSEQGVDLCIACLWIRSTRRLEWLETASVIQEFVEPGFNRREVLFILTPTLADRYLLQAQITRLLELSRLDTARVLAPVVDLESWDLLRRKLPASPPVEAQSFEQVRFSGIFKEESYTRLGLGTGITKNQHIPQLIRERQSALLRDWRSGLPGPTPSGRGKPKI